MDNNITTNYGVTEQNQAQGGAGMSIASLVLGILSILTCCLFFISIPLGAAGIVLGAIVIAKHKSGKGMAIAGLVMSCVSIAATIIVLAMGGIAGLSDKKPSDDAIEEIKSSASTTAPEVKPTEAPETKPEAPKTEKPETPTQPPETESNDKNSGGSDYSHLKDNVQSVGINEEFGNKTIAGVVTNVNWDYKEGAFSLITIPEGCKAIKVDIKLTNRSNDDNYVTVSDFDCYVDDISVDAELFAEGNWNANISPGRSAVINAVYVIPADAKSVELEYNPIGEWSDRIIIKLS